MANDPVSLANRALALVGTRSSISSFFETSNEAFAAAMWYDATRQELLRMAPWDCARNYNTLALLKAAPGTPENTSPAPTSWNKTLPPPPWAYEYAYPSDCLRLLRIVPMFATALPPGTIPPTTAVPIYWTGPTVKFNVTIDQDNLGNDMRVILSNQPQAIGVYIRDVQNPNVFDSQFVQAFCHVFAARMIVQLTGDKSLANMKIQEANRMVELARVTDGNEGLTVNDHTPDWIRTRGIAYPEWGFTPNMGFDWGPLFATYSI